MTYLFLDTNVLLHFKRIEEIDWLSLSSSDAVTTILCPTVIRELERQKVMHPQQKLRKRAQAITSNLHAQLSGAASNKIRVGVTLEFISEDPSIDFTTHKLRPEIGDDWLIASVLEWKQRHGGADVRLVSADLGISIKAKAHSIQVVAPSCADRLPDELSADEKQFQQLQNELAELKDSLPKLEAVFAGGKKFLKFKLTPPLPRDAALIDAMLKAVRAKYPLEPVSAAPKKLDKEGITLGELQRREQKEAPQARSRWPRSEVIRYNSTLEVFYKDYEEYLSKLHEFRNGELKTIRFELELKNDGTSPAEDVDIHFHFPDGFTLFDAEDDDKLPKPPTPPNPPQHIGTFGFDYPGLSGLRAFSSLSAINMKHLGPPPNISPLSIKRTNSFDVRSQVKRAKHGYSHTIGSFVLVFDTFDTARSFQIDYWASAGNLPKSIGGKLSVVIEK